MAWLAPQCGDRILDVGFGRGQALSFIADKVEPNGRATGVEPDPGKAVALTEASASDGSATPIGLVANSQALPFTKGTFDGVHCVNVLEAMTNRTQAVEEMRRVLKPAGRILLAHDDHESQVYSCSDREPYRRVVRAYAESTFKSYSASDGQMGRRVWGLFRAAGFAESDLRVLPLINTEYSEPLLGWTRAQSSAQLVSEVSDLRQQDIERWQADLAETSDRGEYVYCLNLYICLGRK